jgi:hypothetical protein
MKEGDAKLEQAEVKSCFFDPLIKFPMVGVESFDGVGLGYKASELTVEGDEVSSLNFL